MRQNSAKKKRWTFHLDHNRKIFFLRWSSNPSTCPSAHPPIYPATGIVAVLGAEVLWAAEPVWRCSLPRFGRIVAGKSNTSSGFGPKFGPKSDISPKFGPMFGPKVTPWIQIWTQIWANNWHRLQIRAQTWAKKWHKVHIWAQICG